jgi:hypothetical protein
MRLFKFSLILAMVFASSVSQAGELLYIDKSGIALGTGQDNFRPGNSINYERDDTFVTSALPNFDENPTSTFVTHDEEESANSSDGTAVLDASDALASSGSKDEDAEIVRNDVTLGDVLDYIDNHFLEDDYRVTMYLVVLKGMLAQADEATISAMYQDAEYFFSHLRSGGLDDQARLSILEDLLVLASNEMEFIFTMPLSRIHGFLQSEAEMEDLGIYQAYAANVEDETWFEMAVYSSLATAQQSAEPKREVY